MGDLVRPGRVSICVYPPGVFPVSPLRRQIPYYMLLTPLVPIQTFFTLPCYLSLPVKPMLETSFQLDWLTW